MADRENTSSLSAEEQIARILEELDIRIDSQADRITAQLAPVERNVSAIEENLRILGYENGAPTQQNERYRPPARSDPERAEPEAQNSEAPEFIDPEFVDPEFEEFDSEVLALEVSEPEAPKIEAPQPVAPKLESRKLVEPESEAPAPEAPESEKPETDDSWEPESVSKDDLASDDRADDDDSNSDTLRPKDLPFETDGLSEEDMNLADEALKSDLSGLFDDGEHAIRNPISNDPIVSPTPFPTAPAPTRSRPIYLLAIELMFLTASIGIGAFIWFELTSPEVPFAAIDQPPSETLGSAPAPELLSNPPSPVPVRTAAPKLPGTTPEAAETIAAAPRKAHPPGPVKPETGETAELSEPEDTTNTPPVVTAPAETTQTGKTPTETSPGARVASTRAADAQAAEKPAPTNSEFDTLRHRAAAGDSDAQYKIAIRYLVGRGIEQDYTKAAKWLQEAAASGVISAQYNLGVLYDSGRGVDPDPVEALIWFHSAAEKGHGRAQYALAAAYAAGRGIERDSDMALKWLRRAAAENILEAQSSLANILATSPVSHDSLEEAYYWYRLADVNGDGKAADKAELVAARLTPEERADVSRRVSAFIAAKITGKRQRTLPPSPPAPPAPPVVAPVAPVAPPAANAPKATTPTTDAQFAAPPAAATSNTTRIRTIQALLSKLGFETGPADGSLGTQTRDAIRNYQRDLGLDVNGEPSEALLAHLRQISGIRK